MKPSRREWPDRMPRGPTGWGRAIACGDRAVGLGDPAFNHSAMDKYIVTKEEIDEYECCNSCGKFCCSTTGSNADVERQQRAIALLNPSQPALEVVLSPKREKLS